MSHVHCLIKLLLVLFTCSLLGQALAFVSRDHKAIIINGQRMILLSGSIHYLRSTPEVFHSNVFLGSFHVGLFFFYQMGTLKFLPFVRCGQILFRRQRKEVWMSFKLMFLEWTWTFTWKSNEQCLLAVFEKNAFFVVVIIF